MTLGISISEVVPQMCMRLCTMHVPNTFRPITSETVREMVMKTSLKCSSTSLMEDPREEMVNIIYVFIKYKPS